MAATTYTGTHDLVGVRCGEEVIFDRCIVTDADEHTFAQTKRIIVKEGVAFDEQITKRECGTFDDWFLVLEPSYFKSLERFHTAAELPFDRIVPLVSMFPDTCTTTVSVTEEDKVALKEMITTHLASDYRLRITNFPVKRNFLQIRTRVALNFLARGHGLPVRVIRTVYDYVIPPRS